MSGCQMEYVPDNETNSTDDYEISHQEADNSQLYLEVAMFIVRYLWPLVILAGSVGNLLTFLVLIRRRMRRTPVYFYLAMLACADTLVLYLSGFKTWLRVVTGFELLHLSNGTCKAFMFMFLQSLHLSAFFIVAVTLDRFLTVMFPFNKSVFGNLRHTKMASLLAFVFLMLYNCHVFWTIGLQTYSDGWLSCSPTSRTFFICDVFPWLKFSLYTIIPFFVVFSCNLCIVHKMFQAQHQFTSGDSALRSNGLRMGEYRITLMLLGVSVSWIVLTLPFTVFIFIYQDDGSREGWYFLLKTLCFTLLYLNHALNFYLYCLTGKRFRKELAEAAQTVRRWRSRRNSTFAIRVFSYRGQAPTN